MPITIAAPAPLTEEELAKRSLIPDKTVVPGTIDEIVIRRNKADDGYYLNVLVLTTATGPYPDHKIYGMVSLKATARWKLDEFFAAVGVPDDQFTGAAVLCYSSAEEDAPTEVPPNTFVFDVLYVLGEEVQVEVSQETYEGKTNNRIRRFVPRNPLGAGIQDEIPF